MEYHRILAQRKQLEQIRDDLRAEQQETEDEDKAERLGATIERMEERIKALVEPQRKARVGAFAPRLKMEGRMKGGWLGQRKKQVRRQRPSRDEFKELRRQKLAMVAGKWRVVELMKRFRRLKKRASEGDDASRAVVLEVIQILQPLTGLPSQAVMRSDLPPLTKIREGFFPFRVDLTATEWGGRQDIDLIELYLHHAAQFEQVYRILGDWDLSVKLIKIQVRQEEQREAGLQRQLDESEESDGGEDPDLGTPFAARLAPIVQRFNDSAQEEFDYKRAIKTLRDWIENKRDNITQPLWPPLSDRQRGRIIALLAQLGYRM